MYIAPGQGQTDPRGQNFDVNRKALSLPGDIHVVLMSTETSCHFGHLLLVSNHIYSCVQNFKVIGLLVLNEKIFSRWPSWSCDQDRLNKLSSPLPKEAPYEIWLQSTQ